MNIGIPAGTELTAAGEAFLQAVQEMPTLAERATKAARQATRGETGSLRFGFTASAAFNAAVPSVIRAFRSLAESLPRDAA
jgi:DNA-binding transcriptional LysR family regulator